MTLPDFFPHAFYINLDNRPQRRADFEAEMARAGLADYVQRFPAVDGTGPDKALYPHAAGEACAKSHHNLIAHAAANKYERVLIFEDDARFYNTESHSGRIIVEAALGELENLPAWDLLYLGGFPYQEGAVQLSPHVFQVKKILTTHAYAVNASAYAEFLHGTAGHCSIDSWLCEHKNFVKYVVYPLAVIQGAYPSDIARFPLEQHAATYINAYAALEKISA